MSEIFRYPGIVTKLEERHRTEHVSGFGTDAVMKPVSIGWYIVLDIGIALPCGTGKPEYEVGDRVELSLRNLSPARPDIKSLLARAKDVWDGMTPEQRAEMLKKQGEGWAKAELQWAKDFAAGKTERD